MSQFDPFSGKVGTAILEKSVSDFVNDLDGSQVSHHSEQSPYSHGDNSMHKMKMWFHSGFKEVILFDFWQIDSLNGMFWSCILVLLMGACYEGLKWGRVHLQMRISPLSSHRFAHFLPVLYMLQLLIAYWLMLVVMTYNVYLTAATIIGAGLGHAFFAVWKPWGFNELAQDACH